MISVLLQNETAFPLSDTLLTTTVQKICDDHGFRRGEVSLAIVDDATIHKLNREHLQHDYPTDVLSFLLDCEDHSLEGEVIVSADTATRAALEYAWSPAEELLLYCIHGTLHLVGYDDHSEADCVRMRDREQHYLALAGVDLDVVQRATPKAVRKEASA